MYSIVDKFAQYWKTLIAAAGTVAVVVQAIASADRWVAPVLAGLTTVGVYLKRNKAPA